MKRKLSAPLSAPDMKKRAQQDKLGCPFPVPVGSITGVEPSNNYWALYRGRLVSLQGRPGLLLTCPEEVRALYGNGAFGEVLVNRRLEDQARPLVADWTPGCDELQSTGAEEGEKPMNWAQLKESEQTKKTEETEETEEDGSHLDCLQTDGRLRLSPSSHVPSNTCNTRPSQSRVQ